jgi:hypothetical protein
MNPWMQAHHAQGEAIRILDWMIREQARLSAGLQALVPAWRRDRTLLQTATPFAWGADPVQAVWAASKAVPLDTHLTHWNLPVTGAWWHLAQPLPIITTKDATTRIRAMNLAWMGDVFVVTSWMDCEPFGLAGSQTFGWCRGETIAEMLTRCEGEHGQMYGPGGIFEHADRVDVPVFLKAAREMAQFIVAGLAWMGQKLLVETPAPIERHARKAYERARKATPPAVRVIHLRATQHGSHDPHEPGESTRAYQCRWLVGGHWRNQPCGPGRTDRRLTFISPYIKGPDDQPFKTPATPVFEVVR